MLKLTQRLRDALAGDRLLLTDGGMETTLVFHEGQELPCFAAFDLLRTEEGTARIRDYYRRYLALARQYGMGFVLESPTWRASPDWGAKLGYSRAALEEVNRAAVAMMHDLRAEHEAPHRPVIVSGNIGPRGDAYRPESRMSAREAQAYHAWQIAIFAKSGVDLVSAFTLPDAGEAAGIVAGARVCGLPSVISFTVETDGRLPSGQALGDAIGEVDDATEGGPLYYMINCAHPTHFERVLADAGPWRSRIAGLRANASRRSHAELDEASELDMGDPPDLGARYAALRDGLPALKVVGGCCGTDERHVAAIAEACGHKAVLPAGAR